MNTKSVNSERINISFQCDKEFYNRFQQMKLRFKAESRVTRDLPNSDVGKYMVNFFLDNYDYVTECKSREVEIFNAESKLKRITDIVKEN